MLPEEMNESLIRDFQMVLPSGSRKIAKLCAEIAINKLIEENSLTLNSYTEKIKKSYWQECLKKLNNENKVGIGR